jgi:hypothetical protein
MTRDQRSDPSAASRFVRLPIYVAGLSAAEVTQFITRQRGRRPVFRTTVAGVRRCGTLGGPAARRPGVRSGGVRATGESRRLGQYSGRDRRRKPCLWESGHGRWGQLVGSLRDRRGAVGKKCDLAIAFVAYMDGSAWPHRRHASRGKNLAASRIAPDEGEGPIDDEKNLSCSRSTCGRPEAPGGYRQSRARDLSSPSCFVKSISMRPCSARVRVRTQSRSPGRIIA